MALISGNQRVAHALDWLVRVFRPMGSSDTIQAFALVDSTGAYVDPTTGLGGSFTASTPTTIGDGSEVVALAGTRVQLGAATSKKIIITAKVTNTGTIWVGGSTVAAGRGIPLVALQNVTLELSDVSAVYIDATVNGEGVTYAYTN